VLNIFKVAFSNLGPVYTDAFGSIGSQVEDAKMTDEQNTLIYQYLHIEQQINKVQITLIKKCLVNKHSFINSFVRVGYK